ncbi:IS3 family transposase [Fictibacillus sp. UD]
MLAQWDPSEEPHKYEKYYLHKYEKFEDLSLAMHEYIHFYNYERPQLYRI